MTNDTGSLMSPRPGITPLASLPGTFIAAKAPNTHSPIPRTTSVTLMTLIMFHRQQISTNVTLCKRSRIPPIRTTTALRSAVASVWPPEHSGCYAKAIRPNGRFHLLSCSALSSVRSSRPNLMFAYRSNLALQGFRTGSRHLPARALSTLVGWTANVLNSAKWAGVARSVRPRYESSGGW